MAHLAVGQCFMVGFDGTEPPVELIQLIREEEIGGVILFRRNIQSLQQLLRLTGQLQEIANGKLLIGVDHEGGRVFRMPHPFTQIPTMRAVGQYAAQHPEADIARKLGQVMGRELAAAGIHINFAPVLDLDTNANNPIIGDRAFSADPLVVANLGCHMIAGHLDVGVIPCGKHFPGHGDTYEDSHHALPRLPHTLERLDIMELVPFRAAVRAQVPMLMTAHIVFEALDQVRPITLSPRGVDGLLRDKCGFNGVVVTDDLHMQGIAKYWSIEDATCLSMNAGCDLQLICRYPDSARRAIEAIKMALTDGVIRVERLEESVTRIRDLRRHLHDKQPPLSCVGSKDHRAIVDPI